MKLWMRSAGGCSGMGVLGGDDLAGIRPATSLASVAGIQRCRLFHGFLLLRPGSTATGRAAGPSRPAQPSNSGPSTHTNWAPPSTTTRQPPHMPVPSIITVFRLTMVGTPKGSVVRATNFIMTPGPMAQTRAISPGRSSRSSRSGSVTRRLAAVRAVVGAHDQLVGDGAHAVLPEQEVAGAGADDRDHPVPGLLEGAGDGEDRGDADAAADADHRAVVFDLGGVAQRPGDGGEGVAHRPGRPSAWWTCRPPGRSG